MNEAKAREIVTQRADGRCEIAVPKLCLGVQDSIHHRRKPGRDWAVSNLLAACGDGTRGCHGYVEAHPTWAEHEGLWLITGQAPAATRVHMRWMSQKNWWLLDDEGGLLWDGTEFEDLELASADPGMSQVQHHRKAGS